MSFTPGPWRVGDAGVTVFGPPNGNPSPETIANVRRAENARLIAAAPVMFEDIKASALMFDALSRLLVEYGHAEQANSCRIQADNLYVTIAKAEGR